MREGMIEDPNMAEAHYSAASIKDNIERGKKPSAEAIKDADALIGIFENSDIDWAPVADKLREIATLPALESERQLNVTLEHLLITGKLDYDKKGVVELIRDGWKRRAVPAATAAAAMLFALRHH